MGWREAQESVFPDDPIVAGWWRKAAEREEAERRAAAAPPVLDRPEWRLPALAARAGRYMRQVDAALASSGPCDCIAMGYLNGCIACRPDWRTDWRSTGPTPGHGIEAQWAGEIEYRGGGRILGIQ